MIEGLHRDARRRDPLAAAEELQVEQHCDADHDGPGLLYELRGRERGATRREDVVDEQHPVASG